MGGASSSSSFLANSLKRKAELTKVRGALLDQPGIPRRGGPPPPVSPAQDKTSPQQKALAGKPEAGAAPTDQPIEGVPSEEQAKTPAIDVDPETRQEMLGQIDMFLKHVKQVKRAKLHQSLGRSRKFWGGGL
ncbi:hypothetical protein LCGC14_0289300 [marine sediment metagenome]|uniref:Uncharacterized protein n=1 Tax=marine sediment metagenome TaxID=412755 RepID=A0A0F9WZG5_9ZZZZ